MLSDKEVETGRSLWHRWVAKLTRGQGCPMPIIVEVEEKFQALALTFEAALAEVRGALQRAEQGALDYREVEERLADVSGQVECAGHQIVLQSLASGPAPPSML